MTSEARFFNLLKEDMKHRSISLVLSSIVEFIFFPVAILIYFTGASHVPSEFAVNYVADIVVGRALAYGSIVVAVIGAIICAYASFDYVFSRNKVDFFNSVPFSRGKIFWARYLNGILVYLVPFLVFLALSVPIYVVNVGINAALVRAFIKLAAVGFISFMITYNIFILGCMLSGNHANAGFFALFFSSFSGLSAALIIGYMATFFKTFMTFDGLEVFVSRITLGYYVATAYNLKQNLLPSLVIIIVLLVLNYFLFVKRHFENSNAGGIYRRLNNVVRFYLEILISLGVGLFFCVITDKSFGWLIFGILLGAVISHILIYALFNMSMKGALKQKISLAVAIFISIIVASTIRFDVIGYDKYMPNESELASVDIDFLNYNLINSSRRAIFSDKIEKSINSLDSSDFYSNTHLKKKISDGEKDSVKISGDLSAAYEFLRLAKECSLEGGYEYGYYSYEGYKRIRDINMQVVYNLKNKTKVYRRYFIAIPEGKESTALSKLFNSEAFKKGLEKKILVRDFEKLDRIIYAREYTYEGTGTDFIIKKEHYGKIYEALKKDIANISINEFFSNSYNGRGTELRFVYKIDKGYDILDVPIAGVLTETMKVLKDINSGAVSGIGDENVNLLKISTFYRGAYETPEVDESKGITDKELIKQILVAVKEDLKDNSSLIYSDEIQLEMFVDDRYVGNYNVVLEGKAYKILKDNGLIK